MMAGLASRCLSASSSRLPAAQSGGARWLLNVCIWQILLQKSRADRLSARIESGSRLQRFDVAPLHAAANQCCAIKPAKYFCSSIGTSATLSDTARKAALSSEAIPASKRTDTAIVVKKRDVSATWWEFDRQDPVPRLAPVGPPSNSSSHQCVLACSLLRPRLFRHLTCAVEIRGGTEVTELQIARACWGREVWRHPYALDADVRGKT
jgi:hypothetical protein